jgi:beta-N-acetylhexosaminidase
LREELGFKGLVDTDALDMQAVTKLYSSGEAAVRALEAGADVLLMPPDPDACVKAILAAIESHRLSADRIDESYQRVVAAKTKIGLFETRTVDLDVISDNLETKKWNTVAQNAADRAFTIVKNNKQMFPLSTSQGSCLVVMSEGAFSTRGQILARELKSAIGTVYVAHSSTPESLLTAMADSIAGCKSVYIATFVTVGANRGNVALQGGLGAFLKKIVGGSAPVALVSFGSPYLLRNFPDVTAYAATFSVAGTSEMAAAKAILGEIAVTGKLPVSIPPIAKLGDGLDVPAKAKSASNASK